MMRGWSRVVLWCAKWDGCLSRWVLVAGCRLSLLGDYCPPPIHPAQVPSFNNWMWMDRFDVLRCSGDDRREGMGVNVGESGGLGEVGISPRPDLVQMWSDFTPLSCTFPHPTRGTTLPWLYTSKEWASFVKNKYLWYYIFKVYFLILNTITNITSSTIWFCLLKKTQVLSY